MQVKTENYNIRVINAYGPQEDNYNKEDIYNFWQELEEEVVSAKDDDCLVLIQLDANAKLGSKIIKDDPHDMTENGQLLLDILDRQNLTAVNSMNICDGVITRERITKARAEKSVIDFVIVCSKLKEFVKYMLIDESRVHVLTKYASRNGMKKKSVSDHNILMCRFSIHVVAKLVTLRKEYFLLKDSEDQKKFYEETNLTDKLSSSFDKDRSFIHNANVFFRNLKSCIHQNF